MLTTTSPPLPNLNCIIVAIEISMLIRDSTSMKIFLSSFRRPHGSGALYNLGISVQVGTLTQRSLVVMELGYLPGTQVSNTGRVARMSH